jgi:hypothetical protein
MDEVVSGALQRLRPADIIRVVGLAVAASGQEYSRTGVVRETVRQGTRLSGVVSLAASTTATTLDLDEASTSLEDDQQPPEYYAVEVDVAQTDRWRVRCTCGSDETVPCVHAATLLYRWLADPRSFLPAAAVTIPSTMTPAASSVASAATAGSAERELAGSARLRSPAGEARGRSAPPFPQRGPMPLGNLADLLTQLPLSELRNIAREYQVTPNGLSRQQLAEAILAAYKQPEIVQRVVSKLEKAQRQLLAALCLVGGSLTDEELRGIFERFSIGYANQLQAMLSALQRKGLLFRTNLHGLAPAQRFAASSSLLDVGPGWHVPPDVRTALHITVPVTRFNVEEPGIRGQKPVILNANPAGLLAELLLVARALDGSRLAEGPLDQEAPPLLVRSGSPTSTGITDGSATIPPPPERPSPALLETLQNVLPRPSLFLRFAISLLRLADILYRDDHGRPYLRVLSNAARLLLGPGQAEALSDLFRLWITRASYDDLFDLQELGLRLRCRSTLMHHPVLRPGELAAENSEARQTLLALLAQVPVGRWVSFAAFARFIYRLTPTFLQRRQRAFSAPHWWIEYEEGRPLRPTQMQDWMRAEGQYLARLIQGPLHWFGLCDLALDERNTLLAFRLTSLAAQLLSGTIPDALPTRSGSDSSQRRSSAVEVLPENELLVAASVEAWPLLKVIESFTEAAGVWQGRLRYRLSPRSFSEALRQGMPVQTLSTLLRREAAGGEASSELDGLLATLESWGASYGQLRFYAGVSLLQTADPLVMRELSVITSLDTYVIRALQPTVLVLDQQGVEVVTEELKRRGQIPLLHDEETYEAG